MSVIPVDFPKIPFLGEIPGGLKEGTTLWIKGVINKDDSFWKNVTKTVNQFITINIQCGPNVNPRDHVALHLSIRPGLDHCIVRNTLVNRMWGREERQGGMPIEVGKPFEIGIKAEKSQFYITVNSAPFCVFTYRLSPDMAKFLEINGEVVINSIKLHSQAPLTPQTPIIAPVYSKPISHVTHMNPTMPPTMAPVVAPPMASNKAQTMTPTIAPVVAPPMAPNRAQTMAPTMATNRAQTVAPTMAPVVAPPMASNRAQTMAPTMATNRASTHCVPQPSNSTNVQYTPINVPLPPLHQLSISSSPIHSHQSTIPTIHPTSSSNSTAPPPYSSLKSTIPVQSSDNTVHYHHHHHHYHHNPTSTNRGSGRGRGGHHSNQCRSKPQQVVNVKIVQLPSEATRGAPSQQPRGKNQGQQRNRGQSPRGRGGKYHGSKEKSDHHEKKTY